MTRGKTVRLFFFAMQCVDFHGPQRIDRMDFIDPLTFLLAPSVKYSLSFSYVGLTS